MIKRKVQKSKGSYIVTIPCQICEIIGLEKGMEMCIEYRNDKLIMYPVDDDQLQ